MKQLLNDPKGLMLGSFYVYTDAYAWALQNNAGPCSVLMVIGLSFKYWAWVPLEISPSTNPSYKH